MKILLKLLYIPMLAVMLVGCVAQKNVLYLQDMTLEDTTIVKNNYDLKIVHDDLLSITVNSRTPELTTPFTLQSGGSESSSGGIEYLVDSQGNIDFPILGKLHVLGMTRMELSEYIKNRLIDEEYIKDPIVIVKFNNFKIVMLGALGSKVLNIPTDRVTIFEAISMAGDLDLTARRKNIMILREENGIRVPYYLNLKSKDVFDSPCFYLKQNDMVYVEPNKTGTRGNNSSMFKNIGTWTSLISFVASILTLIFVTK